MAWCHSMNECFYWCEVLGVIPLVAWYVQACMYMYQAVSSCLMSHNGST